MDNITKPINLEKGKTSVAYESIEEKGPMLARIVSFILHPFFIGIYTISLLFLYTDFNLLFAGQFVRFISPVLFLTCVVPASSVYFLRKMGLVKNYALYNKSDRSLPYIATFFAYCLLTYYFSSAKLYTWFIAMLVAPTLLTVIAAIINIRWKISAHMIGIGGLIGCTLSVCYNVKGLNPYILFIILFILAGCLGVSRLILKRHTPAQVYAGFLTGLIVSYVCIWIGAYWGLISFMKNL